MRQRIDTNGAVSHSGTLAHGTYRRGFPHGAKFSGTVGVRR
ncbi:MAG TPA: hypothetical protein VGM60_16840 [Pseudonocardia sp.]